MPGSTEASSAASEASEAGGWKEDTPSAASAPTAWEGFVARTGPARE